MGNQSELIRLQPGTDGNFVTPGIWQEYTGDLFRVMGCLRHSETHEMLVLISPMVCHDVVAMPATEFFKSLEYSLPRFQRVGEEWILTSTGRRFPLFNPSIEDVDIHDIAAALSKQCRFAGHPHTFYSVAQHSVMASYIVPPEDALAALLHDAAESYLFDATRPLKQFLVNFKAIEHRIQMTINRAFGIPNKKPRSVQDADMQLLATERRDLMPPTDDVWPCLEGYTALANETAPWFPKQAEQLFLTRFRQLTEEVC
jgi:hypothetical protein